MTLWLTSLTPNLDHRDTLTDLADVTRLHRRLMSLFPDSLGASARSAAGLLFRVETAANSVRVLLQSSIQPDLSRLPHRYGHAETTQLDGFLQMLTNGMTVRYRITANPSKQLPRGHPGPGHPGQRVALRGAQAEVWWRKRADHVGLTLTNVVMLPRQDLVGHQMGQISKGRQERDPACRRPIRRNCYHPRRRHRPRRYQQRHRARQALWVRPAQPRPDSPGSPRERPVRQKLVGRRP